MYAWHITRKLKPIILVYHIAGAQLQVVSAEKDLKTFISFVKQDVSSFTFLCTFKIPLSTPKTNR